MANCILSRFENTIDQFSGILKCGDLTEYENTLAKWQNLLEDLKSWRTQVDLIVTPGFSLEFWLRDSIHLDSHLHWLISSLENLVGRLDRLLKQPSIPQENEPDCSEPSEASKIRKTVHAELEKILSGISQTAYSFDQILPAIQKPMPKSRLSGVSKTYITSLESSDRKFVHDKFPDARKDLIDRLGIAISKRRAILKVWADDKARSGKIGCSTGHAAAVRIHCSVPPSPHFEDNEATTECPYCHFLLTRDHDWTQHIVHDALPYICVAKDCTTASKLYASFDEWGLHLTIEHASEFPQYTSFGCPLCSLDLNNEEFKVHMASHLEPLAMYALPDLAIENTPEARKQAQTHQRLLKFADLLKHMIELQEERKEDKDDPPPQSDEASNREGGSNNGEHQNQEEPKNDDTKDTNHEFWKTARTLFSDSKFSSTQEQSSSRKEPDMEKYTGETQHELPIHVDNQKNIRRQKSGSNESTYSQERKRLTKLATNSPKPQEKEEAIVGQRPAPTFDNKTSILKCDLCYRVFDGESDAESHRIEQGHIYFVDVTQETIRERQKKLDEQSSTCCESPVVSVEAKARRRKLWDDYPKTLSEIKSPEKILEEQRLHDQMEIHMRNSVQMLEKTFGPNDELLLQMLSSLAHVLQMQGRFVEAEKEYRRVLKGYEATGGSSSLNAFETMHNLSILLHDRYDYLEAERKSRQSLAGIERIAGRNGKSTLRGLHNLAKIMQSKFNFEEAEELFGRAWEGRKGVLGRDDPETLDSLQGFAICLQRRDHHSRAEKLLREALDDSERSFGKNDPRTLLCVFNLSRVLHQQEKSLEAKELYDKVKAARTKLLENDTQQSLLEMYETAIQLRHYDRLKASEDMCRRAAEGFERLLGRDHNFTLASLNGLGVALRQQGKLRDAVQILEEVAEGSARVRGRYHPETHKAFINLANVYMSMGKTQTYEMMLRRELEPLRAHHGRNDPISLSALINLTSAIGSQGRGKEALDLVEEEIRFFEELTQRSDCGAEELSKTEQIIKMLKLQINQITENTGQRPGR